MNTSPLPSPYFNRPGMYGSQRRHILKSLVSLAALAMLEGRSHDLFASVNNSSRVQPVPSGPIAETSLSVFQDPIGTIGPAFAGLSYEKSALCDPSQLFRKENTNLIRLFRLLGSSILRIGGNTVDRTHWALNGTGRNPGQIAPSDVDSLAGFLKATGWHCLYAVNLGGAGPNPYVKGNLRAVTTARAAAEEVAYVASRFGPSLAGIEIGNECDLYGKTYFNGAVWNLEEFEKLWSQFRDAILTHAPGVKITGPADASNLTSWTIPFGRWATRNRISLLTQHFYRGNGQAPGSTAAYLVQPDPHLAGGLASLHSASQSIGVPFRFTECNSYYNGGAGGVSNAFCSALWVLDFLFDCALGGAAGVNFHGGGHGPGYTPIADSGGYVAEARPEFYGITFFAKVGQGELHSTHLPADSLNVTAYAIKPLSGGMKLVIINKDETRNIQMTIQMPQSVSMATLIELRQSSNGAKGPSLSATSGVSIQGSSISADGTFMPRQSYILKPRGSQLSCYVPPLSAVLIQTS